MKIQTGKKLGFFAAITMLIGSVVGIGIFFKSHGILRANDWNGIGTLLAWLLGGLLSLAAAISFSEIGSVKTRNVSGLPAYSEKFGGKLFGYFVRFNFSVFYYGILAVVLGFFGSEVIVGMIQTFRGGSTAEVPIFGHAIIAVAITAGFIALNFWSVKASGIWAQVSTVLKWIPLLAVAILGIALATTNHASIDNFGKNAFTNGQPFNFTHMLAALPAVLFAYDAFLGTLSLKD